MAHFPPRQRKPHFFFTRSTILPPSLPLNETLFSFPYLLFSLKKFTSPANFFVCGRQRWKNEAIIYWKMEATDIKSYWKIECAYIHFFSKFKLSTPFPFRLFFYTIYYFFFHGLRNRRFYFNSFETMPWYRYITYHNERPYISPFIHNCVSLLRMMETSVVTCELLKRQPVHKYLFL